MTHEIGIEDSTDGFIDFDGVRSWLFDSALPFWADVGVDRRHGGFVEHLDLSGAPAEPPFKRIRAQARQIYCFSHAAILGWDRGRELSDHGWRFLAPQARRADGAWVRTLGRTGGVLDATCDAYDMAFVLFAHSWRYRLTGETALVDGALATLDAMDRLLRDGGAGYRAAEDGVGARQQNPHMHLLEATLELADSTGHPRFASLSAELYGLFSERMFDRDREILPELFGRGWEALPDEAIVVEPGHMMEWSWILYRAHAILGLPAKDDARRLYRQGLRIGRASLSGLTVDMVGPDGDVRSSRTRCWPQTETLKAHLAAFEFEGLDTRAEIARCVDNLLVRYLAVEPKGTWIDHLDGDGAPCVDKIPSTTFYHLFLAFSELLRLEDRLKAAPIRP